MRHRMLTQTFLALVLAGCAQQPAQNLQEPLPEVATTEPVEPGQLEAWCQAYQPPALVELIQRALESNRDLAVARANLREARASARAAGAARWPTLNLEGSARRGRQPFLGDVPENVPIDFETTLTRYRAGLAAQYELDLWGRLASESQAAALEADATAYDLQTSRVTLSSEVAGSWFDVVAQGQLSDLLNAEAEASSRILDLTRLRFAQGQVQGLDIVQQRQQAESIQGQLVLARAQTGVAANQLNALLGEGPASSPPQTDGDLPQPPPLPLEGIPANLLQLRPDLASAARRMASADQQAAAAVAERLPGLQLSAQLFSEARSLSNLFETLFWNLLGSVNLVVFDGGRLEAQADVADARAEAALEQYAQTYLTALAEVGNALILEQAQRANLSSLRNQHEAAERALRLARKGYRNGAVDYLRVLTAQQALLQTERSLIESGRQLLSYRLQTCRALGYAPGLVSRTSGEQEATKPSAAGEKL